MLHERQKIDDDGDVLIVGFDQIFVVRRREGAEQQRRRFHVELGIDPLADFVGRDGLAEEPEQAALFGLLDQRIEHHRHDPPAAVPGYDDGLAHLADLRVGREEHGKVADGLALGRAYDHTEFFALLQGHLDLFGEVKLVFDVGVAVGPIDQPGGVFGVFGFHHRHQIVRRRGGVSRSEGEGRGAKGAFRTLRSDAALIKTAIGIPPRPLVLTTTAFP